jgi:putative inorganic carbon (HCO3(-)) transporter
MLMSKLLVLIDRLHWLWLLLAAPLLLFPTPKRSPAMLVVPGLWLLHGLATRRAPTLSRAEGSHPCPERSRRAAPRTSHVLPLTPLNSAILLMALMVLVSIWATYDIALSLPKLSGMVLAFGVYFAVVREARRPRGWWLSLVLFLDMGVAVAGLGLLGTDWTNKISILDRFTSQFPTLFFGLQGAESGFHPNEVAGALTWVLPILIALSVFLFLPQSTQRARRKNDIPPERLKKEKNSADSALSAVRLNPGQIWVVRLLLWLATLFVGAVFILTQSRSSYIAVTLTLLILLFIALPRRWRWVLFGCLILMVILLGFLLSEEDIVLAQDWLIGKGLKGSEELSLNLLEKRLEIWSRAIYGLQDFPFTGMGMNTFREVVHKWYPLFLIPLSEDIGHAHNEFLQAGLDLGIPGLIAFIALYLGAFWMLADIWRNVPTPVLSLVEGFNVQRATVLGLFGGLLAHMLYGLTDAVALGAKPGVLFWMLLGLVSGFHAQVSASEQE